MVIFFLLYYLISQYLIQLITPSIWNIFFTLLKDICSPLIFFHTGYFFYDSLLIPPLMSYFLTFNFQ